MTPKRIILHCSATEDSGTVSWSAIRRYHIEEKGWQDIGYHFGIELVGDRYEVMVGRMLNQQGAHCEGHNGDSLGVCFVGSFDKVAPPAPQWDTGLRLVRALCQVLNIPPSSVYGHRQFNSNKSCPGVFFNLSLFVTQLDLTR